MSPAWDKIADILAGAISIKLAGVKYLPKFQKESESAYSLRKESAPWRPEFEDALRSLCAKPFTKVVTVDQDAPEVILGKVVNDETKQRQGGLADDIDGQGNSLHVFARDTFWNGVGFGLDAIYVTYPAAEGLRTKSDEAAAGLRPYWVHVRARDIIDLKLTVVGGRTLISEIRIRECAIEASGFAEAEVERIRWLQLHGGAPIWTVFVKDANGNWTKENDGQFVGQSEIPIALFFTGPRTGNYRVKPPLADLAEMQIELYRRLSRQDQIETLAGSPMLVGSGFNPPAAEAIYVDGQRTGERPAPQIEVGPGVVLFAPPASEGVQPSWGYIQPSADNMRVIQESVDKLVQDFRRLAMQPTTPQSGNMVATGAAIDAAKAHSAVEAWANGLADALNLALAYTMQWLRLPDTVTVQMNTDFGVDLQGANEARVIGDAQKRGVVSARTERKELARRGILGPDFDEDQEEQRIAEEQEGLEPEEDFDPVTGEAISGDASDEEIAAVTDNDLKSLFSPDLLSAA